MIETIHGERRFSRDLSPASRRFQKMSSFLTGLPFFPSSSPYNLTISREKQFVWFRVAKVGTRTILDLFDRAEVQLTAEHPLGCFYPVNRYRDYFKFAFVRNPWDRIVSAWSEKVVLKGRFPGYAQEDRSFEHFVDFVSEEIDLERGNAHLRLQSRLIDLNFLDFLGRYERFQEDLTEVMDILGIEGEIVWKNASNKGDYHQYYTERTRDKVADLYRKDIQLFGYTY